jgi:hypothetical protein
MILVRNQIRDMIDGEIGKFTSGRIKYTFRFERKEYRSVYVILEEWGGGDANLKVVRKFMTVFVSRRDSAYS